MYLRWTCPVCFDTIISISGRHHSMDYCKCKKSYCDYEEYGLRFGGNKIVELIHKKQFKTKKINMNFFDELILCMEEQGFEIPTKVIPDLAGFGPFSYYDYSFIRKLEDKMIEDLK